MRCHYKLLQWLKRKSLTILSVGEDVEELGIFYIGITTLENQFDSCFFFWKIICLIFFNLFFSFFYFLNFTYLFIYLWLCWVFISVRGLSLVAASEGHSSSQCAGLSLSRPLLLQSTGSRRAGSAIVAHRPSCYAACGIFPDQGSNPCPLHRQADSQPLHHEGSLTVS